MAHEVNQCETLVNCELKPPMHRENSIQVKTGFQTGQWNCTSACRLQENHNLCWANGE